MKKITALLLCVVMLFTLCGCSLPFSLPMQRDHAAMVMTVSGADIGADLFAYYLTLILRDPAAYELGADPAKDDVENTAIRLCEEYVAIQTAFRDEGLRLTPALKKEIAENVSTKWSFYRNYYNAVGISKRTLTNYETAEAKRRQMVAYLYGTGGAQAVSEVEWNAYYAVNYVTFRSVNGYLTRTDGGGQSTRLPAGQIAEAETLFRTMCDAVRGGTSLEDVCRSHADSPYILSPEVQTQTINRKTNNYPPEFFASVQKMDAGAARVIETTDYIFLVVKQSSKEDENLEQHKLLCLQEMCKDQFSAYLSAMIEGYHVQKDGSAISDLYGNVQKKF